MAHVRGGIVIGQTPADFFRIKPWHADRQNPPGLENPDEFGYGQIIVWDMFEHLGTDDGIKALVSEGQAGDIHAGKVEPVTGQIIQCLMKYQFVSGGFQIVIYKIRTHAQGLFHLAGLDHVPAFTASHVQYPVAGPDVQPVEINGDHG
jgi:hypothetical protein